MAEEPITEKAIELEIGAMVMLNTLSQEMDNDQGKYYHETFVPGIKITANPDNPEANIPIPNEQYAREGNCTELATYYALQYLGEEVEYDEVAEKIAESNGGRIYHFIFFEMALELARLDYGSRAIGEFKRHYNTAHHYNRDGFDPDSKIIELAKDINQGKVLIVGVSDLNGLYRPLEEQETRHAIMIYGFEVTEEGISWY